MGTVFSAWDPKLERNVAVKLLHEAAVDGHRAERFLFERQVLASLEHPHIARLLDAGETDDGRPWFAMDFIDGQPLDAACDGVLIWTGVDRSSVVPLPNWPSLFQPVVQSVPSVLIKAVL